MKDDLSLKNLLLIGLVVIAGIIITDGFKELSATRRRRRYMAYTPGAPANFPATGAPAPQTLTAIATPAMIAPPQSGDAMANIMMTAPDGGYGVY